MRLISVDVRDYRSLFLDGSNQPFRMELADGSNTLVGQNNCGKSNVLRAISLALDPHHKYQPELDQPGPRPFAHPIITLTFSADGSVEGDQSVLDAIRLLEQAFHGSSSLRPSRFSDPTLGFGLEVSFVPSQDGVRRRERIVLAGVGGRASDQAEPLERAAIAALRASVRFVLISTGESIESVLEGNFREILHSVVRDGLQDEFQGAERAREQYIHGLQESLLGPLRSQLASDVRGLFPDIESLALLPEVPSIEETLSHVGVSLDDLVSTPLSRKGTGVRGGVLVAMLSYLALNATRSMVFAVEEPEAFLHPAAQEDLREHLERVAAVPGVSLLITTHSPFIVSRSSSGRVFSLAKDREGRTRVSETARGDADHAPLVGGLLRDASLEQVLAAAAAIPPDARAIVLLEGQGDVYCMELTARRLGRPDLLDGLALRGCGGTVNMVVQSITTKASTQLPIVLVVDNDAPGRKVTETLVGRTFGFNKRQVVAYWRAFDGTDWHSANVEAEDVFSPELIQGFVDHHGEDAVIRGKWRRLDGAWHYDLDQAAKALLAEWLETNARAEHLERWVQMIQLVRTAANLENTHETPAEIVAKAAATTTPSNTRHTDGDVLVLTGQHDYARYQSDGALILPEDLDPGTLTHVAFYNKAIQREVPVVLADHPNLLFTLETAKQLRSTGAEADTRVAEFLEVAVHRGMQLVGHSGRVLLLSAPDDPSTLVLDAPVTNSKQINGRPVAWTIGPKLVPYRAFERGPVTTDELDQITIQLGAHK